MPLFRLISTTPPPTLVAEFHGVNAAGAINVARTSRLAEADLWQADKYLFTLRKHGGEDCWIIYRRKDPAGDLFEGSGSD